MTTTVPDAAVTNTARSNPRVSTRMWRFHVVDLFVPIDAMLSATLCLWTL
jgi:hypothetical protein